MMYSNKITRRPRTWGRGRKRGRSRRGGGRTTGEAEQDEEASDGDELRDGGPQQHGNAARHEPNPRPGPRHRNLKAGAAFRSPPALEVAAAAAAQEGSRRSRGGPVVSCDLVRLAVACGDWGRERVCWL